MAAVCDLILFADAANFSADGKLNLLGEFNILKTSGAQAILSGVFVARIAGSAADIGSHRFSLRILDADGQLVATSRTLDCPLTPPKVAGMPPRVWINMAMPALQLPAPGVYAFEVYFDDVRQGITAELTVVRIS
jgi:hypothetical protein